MDFGQGKSESFSSAFAGEINKMHENIAIIPNKIRLNFMMTPGCRRQIV